MKKEWEKGITKKIPLLYRVWQTMKQRCHNPNDKGFRYYGAKGIVVCDEWRNNFYLFYKWSIANGYKRGLTIERKKSTDIYSPDTCIWADWKTQTKSKKNIHLIPHNGKMKLVSELSKELGISTARVKFMFGITQQYPSFIKMMSKYKNSKYKK